MINRSGRYVTLGVLVLVLAEISVNRHSHGQETTTEPAPFSGPQVGESLPAFTVRGVFDQDAGKDLGFVATADGGPIVLIFVHDVTRPSISMTRILSQYTASRAQDGVTTGVVWLDDDATAAENQLKRIRHALAAEAPVGVSIDGREGPGSYGLNRNVMLTILVGNQGKVTANYALVQPSLQVDLPKILASVVEVAGGEVPKLEELEGMNEMMRRQVATGEPPNMRPLLMPLIRRDASPEQVDEAARAIEARASEEPAIAKEIGRIANTIISAGKLTDYGTVRAQEYLEKWSKEFGEEAETPAIRESTPSAP
jgi:hypothetical protein